jgi:FKBP-type peptidyl-prolyl cis-trans isomerase
LYSDINFKGYINRYLTTSLMTILSVILIGCGDSKEEAAFRATLIEKALNDENAKAGAVFLEKNKALDGMVTLPSGVQYKVIKSGLGATPKLQDKVEVHYEGRLINGKVFDSSYKRNKSSTFPIKEVIAGWRKVLVEMKEGDQWTIYIPSNLAYGAVSPSPAIAANSTLIFDIELIAIKGADNE